MKLKLKTDKKKQDYFQTAVELNKVDLLAACKNEEKNRGCFKCSC